MINVLHLINITGGGGTESYIYSLAKKLHNNKCRFFLAYSNEGPTLRLFQDLGIETIHLPMNNPYDINAAKNLKAICKEKSIDVVHTHFLRENYISILSKVLGNKSILINTRHMLFKNSKSVIYVNKIMTNFNYKIIAVSEAVESALLNEGISKKKIRLIYTGIDLDNWKHTKSFNFRNEFNINKEDLVVASVARFTEEKGHSYFLQSIARMKELLSTEEVNNIKVKFVLIGTGKLLDESIKLAKDLNVFDDIIFTGYRNDINNILRDCDLFVSHSQSEAFGISILEALASGLPVITTDSGGSREIIDKDSDCGILIEYGNVDQLAKSLLQLLKDENLRNSYRENGLKLVHEKFSLDNTIEETYKLYSSNRNL